MISLLSKRFSRVFSSTTVQKHQFFSIQPSLWPNSQICTSTGKTIALTIQTFVSQVMYLHFNTLFRFVIAFLPMSKGLLISWLQSPSSVKIFGAQENKVCHCFHITALSHLHIPSSEGSVVWSAPEQLAKAPSGCCSPSGRYYHLTTEAVFHLFIQPSV